MCIRDSPEGWEERSTPGDNRKYFVDHNTKMTSWVRPTWGLQGARFFTKRPKPSMTASKRCEHPEFQQKRIGFRNAMAMTSTSKEIVQLIVSRDHILEVSAQEFENLNPQQLRSRIRISFPGESEAIDWGGVAQEWFQMIVPALLDPKLGPVSYTHLRAHETPEHLVCRLLLEKKKKKKIK
eukprot:TRINITY_DN12597_c0_g1_i2.p1 TRINITY_DN12597_c0_g1~~TRINITY_DN12597_c0_g1_i2.p1  ORF type:complete len:181 (+),score=47.85 TRINITY_DN12597_c0_g1_i2:170-712(+)